MCSAEKLESCPGCGAQSKAQGWDYDAQQCTTCKGCLSHHQACACREAKFEQLKTSAVDLLSTIDLHTDCMDGKIDREALDVWMDKVEAAIAVLES